MADTDAVKGAKKFYEDVPMETRGFFLKGASSLDWGMKNRLSRIFNPDTGRTVMVFPGPNHRTGANRPEYCAADALCRCCNADAGDSANHSTALADQTNRHAVQRRPEHT